MQAIEHPVERLHTALLSTRKVLIETYQQFSRPEMTFLEEGLLPGNLLFSPITINSDSDWIPAHPEDPQDFQSFYINTYRRSPSSGRNTIYIQTIGSFGEGAVVAEQYVEWLKDYCQAFCYGLVVKLLPLVTVASTACSFRINGNTHNLQLHAGEPLNFLKKRKPRDAFCIVGITMIDLYPRESWNFVFGQAFLTEGMGVFSFARYDYHFYERSYAGPTKKKLKFQKKKICLTFLTFVTLTNEIGHIFGVRHCQWLNCKAPITYGQSDRRPLDLCPICLRKLQSAIGFKIADRYKASLHWIEEGADSTAQHSKPTQAFQEYKHWLYMCLLILEGEKS
uniref:Archaemetzincin-2 n=1 Tax=Sinocyclocheilus rhinocerous TaxID=307959 RepID=A0A673FR72_9TELE